MVTQPKSWPQPPASWRADLPSWCEDGVTNAPVAWVQSILELEKRGLLCPPLDEVWQALALVPPNEVKVVLLGQDPYHGMRQAHGLAFSVADPLLPWPPSLRNVFKERAADLDVPLERSANLQDWAEQGVLLLNAVLTTQMGQAGAHTGQEWEDVVEHALLGVMNQRPRLVWILWGRPAQSLHARVLSRFGQDRPEDVCVASPHPSPLAAHRGFWGSRPFSRANAALQKWGETPIEW